MSAGKEMVSYPEKVGEYYTSDELNECSRLEALEPLPASRPRPPSCKVSCVDWDGCISDCSPGQGQLGFLDPSACDLALPTINLYPVKMWKVEWTSFACN